MGVCCSFVHVNLYWNNVCNCGLFLTKCVCMIHLHWVHSSIGSWVALNRAVALVFNRHAFSKTIFLLWFIMCMMCLWFLRKHVWQYTDKSICLKNMKNCRRNYNGLPHITNYISDNRILFYLLWEYRIQPGWNKNYKKILKQFLIKPTDNIVWKHIMKKSFVTS